MNAPEWAPSVQQVADISQAYTRGPIDGEGEEAGAQQGTFDEKTSPTAKQVEALIEVALEEVIGRVGVEAGTLAECGELARRTVAWHAAASIEADKAPEGASETSSAYAWKQASYVACLNELISQARPPLVR